MFIDSFIKRRQQTTGYNTPHHSFLLSVSGIAFGSISVHQLCVKKVGYIKISSMGRTIKIIN